MKNGCISLLIGYDKFKEIAKDFEKHFAEIKTADRWDIKDYTAHFVDWIIGTHCEISTSASKELAKYLKHKTVSVEEVLQAIKREIPDGIIADTRSRRSQRFIGDTCVVTFNPDTQELIQTNKKRE